MTAVEHLIGRARELGIQLWASEGRLNFRAPRAALTEELRSELLAHKALIIDMLSGPRFDCGPERRTLEFPQDWVSTWQQIRSGAVSINYTNSTHMVCRLDCALDMEALGRSLQELVHRHDALRCRILDDESGLRLAFDGEPRLTVIDLSDRVFPECDPKAADDAIAAAAAGMVWQPFGVGECLFRPFLVELPGSANALGFVVFHVIVDGWSFRQIPDFWMAEYVRQLRPESAGQTRVDYMRCSDYLHAMASWTKTLHFQRRLEFWKDSSRGVRTSRLPPDRIADPDASSPHGWLPFNVDAARVARLSDMAGSLGATLCDVLLAGVAMALHREIRTADVCLRHLWHGRNEPRLFDMIASTVNPLLLRIPMSPENSLRDVVQQVRRVTLEAIAHEVPYYFVERELNEAGTTAFVQTNFQLREKPGDQAGEPAAASAPLRRIPVPNPHAWWSRPRYLQAHDINLSISNGAIRGGIVFLRSVYDEATIRKFVEGFARALDGESRV